MKNQIIIQKKKFHQYKPMIVGEISCNHNGNINHAKKLIDTAKKSGFDAVKLQTLKPEEITLNSNKKDFQLSHVKNKKWSDFKNYYSIYKSAYTPWEWLPKLFRYANKKKIIIFSSPFDENAVDFLEKYNCPIYKIASPEVNHIPLIIRVAKTNKPIFISTGVANIDDISLAIKTIKKYGSSKIVLLKCNSSYPAKEDNMNLLNIKYLSKKFNVSTGLSDHTKSNLSSIIATTLGVTVIEKHITHTKIGDTLDSFFSLNEHEMKKFVSEINSSSKILGKYKYRISKDSMGNIKSKRSIYSSKKIKKGEVFSNNNIKVVRPAYGLHPKYFLKILGKKSKYDIKEATRIKLSHFY